MENKRELIGLSRKGKQRKMIEKQEIEAKGSSQGNRVLQEPAPKSTNTMIVVNGFAVKF